MSAFRIQNVLGPVLRLSIGRVGLVVATLVTQAAEPAMAQAIRCSAFLHNRDGSWTSFYEGFVLGSFGPVQIHPGERFQVGAPKAKDDVARLLNSICRDDETAAGGRRLPR